MCEVSIACLIWTNAEPDGGKTWKGWNKNIVV